MKFIQLKIRIGLINLDNKNAMLVENITLEPKMMSENINSFSRKLRRSVEELLYNEIADNGKISTTVALEIASDEINIPYVKILETEPSREQRKAIQYFVDELVATIATELTMQIIRSDKYKSQKICCS